MTDPDRKQGVDVDAGAVDLAADGADGAARLGRDEFADWAGPSVSAMHRLALRLAPDADPQDVVQEALARAWVKRGQYDPGRGTATAWLLAIVADQARAARRRRSRWLRLVDDAAPVPERALDHSDPDCDLERAIRALPERQRLAVHLHYFVGLPVDETATVMRCSPGTVKSTLFDARGRLRRFLGGDDD
jgi:RNA polymerase sigma-70 factor (ECF subfamily)